MSMLRASTILWGVACILWGVACAYWTNRCFDQYAYIAARCWSPSGCVVYHRLPSDVLPDIIKVRGDSHNMPPHAIKPRLLGIRVRHKPGLPDYIQDRRVNVAIMFFTCFIAAGDGWGGGGGGGGGAYPHVWCNILNFEIRQREQSHLSMI